MTQQLGNLRTLLHTTKDPYVVHQQAIRDKWRCTTCSSNSFCYIAKHAGTGKDVHIELDPQTISIWAHEMEKKEHATVMYPPRYIKEIDKMMMAAFAMHQRRGPQLNRRRSRDSTISSASSGFAPVIHYNLAPPASMDLPTCPSTPPMATKPPADLMSPIPGFEPKDYNHDGLYAFMHWLQEKYGDDDFEDAFTKLHGSRIGLDLLPNITEAILIDRSHITLGTALRIIKDFKEWKASLKVRTLFTQITLQ